MYAAMMRTVALFVLGLGAVGPATAQETGAGAASVGGLQDIPLSEVLVIGRVGHYRRSALHTDAIEAQLVAGTWRPPQAGAVVKLPDGSSQTWEAASAGEDGWIQHDALRGGYAYAAVQHYRQRVMLLEASAHSLVYVNGAPRAGDSYKTGYVRLPVLLEPGTSHFLFKCGRGTLRAKLVEPKSPISLDGRDATLPDLIVGEPVEVWGAVVLINATTERLTGAHIAAQCGQVTTLAPLPAIPPWTVRKVAFHATGLAPAEGETQEIRLSVEPGESAWPGKVEPIVVKPRVRRPDESHKRTFVSAIDGSVQYYAVQPMQPGGEHDGPPALFLTLHGAGVEALGQVNAYRPKSWGYVVAPTNRRPFGFDWEDWGRLDTLEVLAIAEETLGTDPQRTYLTGHSMGGHGVWQVGVHFPDRFAAIAPSAAWISFWSYAGAQRFKDASPIEQILIRAANPSDTLALSRNFLHHGVYILHGERDDNVPVEQARTMRKHLAEYHADFAYYERPGAGHWWSNACVDWPPLFDFLRSHTRPATHEVRHVEFVTANPVISAACHWATIEQQLESLKLSKIDLHVDAEKRLISGTTENVARLGLMLQVPDRSDPAELHPVLEPGEPLSLELDGQELADVPWPANHRLRLERRDGQWSLTSADLTRETLAWQKSPNRSGPFKEVFRHRVQFVYGTRGTPEENAWAYAKARYDAETFWYRGNGSIDVVADTEFDADPTPERSAVLYGNAETNAAWEPLFGGSPVQVTRGGVRVGDQTVSGDDLAVLAIYPREGGQRALVGVVSGTGIVGMRLTDRLPYFVSGVAYPDWIVLEPRMLNEGAAGVRAAGFFGNDWTVDPDQSAWREPEQQKSETIP